MNPSRLVPLALPFLLAVVVIVFRHSSRATAAWLAAAAPVGGLALLATMTPTILDGGVVRSFGDWLPQIGLAFSVRLDGLAWMFAGMVLAIGALVVVYAHYY